MAGCQALLARMDGPVAPKAWQGGLPFTYRLGMATVRVHMKVDMDTSPKPNYVVEGRLRGAHFQTSGSCLATIGTRGSLAESTRRAARHP